MLGQRKGTAVRVQGPFVAVRRVSRSHGELATGQCLRAVSPEISCNVRDIRNHNILGSAVCPAIASESRGFGVVALSDGLAGQAEQRNKSETDKVHFDG